MRNSLVIFHSHQRSSLESNSKLQNVMVYLPLPNRRGVIGRKCRYHNTIDTVQIDIIKFTGCLLEYPISDYVYFLIHIREKPYHDEFTILTFAGKHATGNGKYWRKRWRYFLPFCCCMTTCKMFRQVSLVFVWITLGPMCVLAGCKFQKVITSIRHVAKTRREQRFI